MVRDILEKRRQHGQYHALLQEMRLGDKENYFNFDYFYHGLFFYYTVLPFSWTSYQMFIFWVTSLYKHLFSDKFSHQYFRTFYSFRSSCVFFTASRLTRMFSDQFDHLLALVEALIIKKTKNFRYPILAPERLPLRLHYLA